MKIINEALLDEFRQAGSCEWCRSRVWRREPHHLWCRGMGGGGRLDILENLIGLCGLCHHAFHNGHIQRCDLLAVVAAREGLTQDQIEEAVYRLRRETK